MAYVERELGLLVRVNPRLAAVKIAAALKQHGTQEKAAVALGVSRSSLLRWMKKLLKEAA